jgi:Ni/Fe-hydrogenase subunit HybB-like protein
VAGLAFLAVTGALLIWDLKHPTRFYLIFTRHHWRSWLVRGSFVLGGYGAVLVLYLLARLAGLDGPARALAWSGVALAMATAAYTAFLFAQARARDLWQSPLLAPHLAVQALLAGGTVTVMAGRWLASGHGLRAAAALLAMTAAVHVALVAAETVSGHPTEHARLAVAALVRGRYARWFWPGLALSAAAVAVPWAGPAAPLLAAGALAGLLAYEHAYVQAGQCVPVA